MKSGGFTRRNKPMARSKVGRVAGARNTKIAPRAFVPPTREELLADIEEAIKNPTSSPRPPVRRSDRKRDAAFLSWVHTQPCVARTVEGHRCGGGIEADHMGSRPMGRKADDDTCAPICSLGHRQRTDFSGPFRSFDQARMRAFLAESIRITRLAYARHLLASSPAASTAF